MKRFNIRVYGIWINEAKHILLSDECIGDFAFTKFPGGGLEFGEGLKDCLIREWREELNIEIEVLQHIYTTDFFQASAFDQDSQVISIYYMVSPKEVFDLSIEQINMGIKSRLPNENIQMKWISFNEFSPLHVTLPIDKKVAKMLKDSFSS